MRRPDDEKNGARQSPSLDDEITSPVSSPVPAKAAVEPVRADTPPRALEQRYELLGEAGRGGMGIVYRARDRETGEQVALKVLKPEIAADAGIVERFKNELRLARKITHKNVCRIHEFNRAPDGTAYISMEFVEGESLRRVLSRFGNLGARGGTRIAQQICAGLREAHTQGVVHRDLKPENVMVDREGNVKVMDFGIARSLETGTTGTTGIMGTPAYMAPEQAEGKAVDPRADIYAFGLILYELFTGSTAFKGDTPMAVALKQIHETPPAPREVEPSLPAHVEKAILKCLEKNPAKRFQSVDELEAALTKEPEAKPAAVEGEGAEVALPISLATWQRSDWFLLASAVLGTALFFLLFYRFHPASAMRVTVDGSEAKQIVADVLKDRGPDLQVERPLVGFFGPGDYYATALAMGIKAAHDATSAGAVGVGMWYGRVTNPREQGKWAVGFYQVDVKGRLVYLRIPQDISSESQAVPPADAPAVARMKTIAQDEVARVFSRDVSRVDPKVSVFPKSLGGAIGPLAGAQTFARGVVFQWELPEQFQPGVAIFKATVNGSTVVELARGARRASKGLPYDWSAGFSPPARWFLTPAMVFLFVLILFLLRKVYRQPRSPQNLRLAVLVGVGAAVAIAPSLPGIGAPKEEYILGMVTWSLLVFCLFTLFSYAALNTTLYYLRRRFPVQAANYLQLFREHVFARAAGLELLRGILAGVAFSGVWMALLWIGGLKGNTLVGMIAALDVVGASVFSPDTVRVLPLLLLGEGLLVAWLLVALPLSLLGKATPRPPVLLAALAGLWMALGFSLTGAMAFPTLPYYVVVALQAAFCGAIFLRYGVLATLSAVFTIEVGLLAFPFLEIFQNVDPLPYTIPVVLWFLLLLAAAGLYFRPQAVSAYRRVAAVFE